MFNRRTFCAFVTLAGVAIAAPVFAQADDYPTRPIKLIVPYAAGGGTDAIARLVANGVGAKIGQSMVVENNGTAGGNVASQTAANSAADGYTVLMANQGPMVVNPHLFKNMKLDPLAAFDPVILVAQTPLVVVVSKSSAYKSFKDVIEYGKQNAGSSPTVPPVTDPPAISLLRCCLRKLVLQLYTFLTKALVRPLTTCSVAAVTS